MFDLAPIVLGLHLASVHVPTLPDQNNINFCVYARAPNGMVVGAYRNTLRRWSFYAGHTSSWGPVDLTVGLVTGYRKHCDVTEQKRPNGSILTEWRCEGFSHNRLTPMFAPSITLPTVFDVTPRVSYIPRVGARSPANVFHLSIEKEF